MRVWQPLASDQRAGPIHQPAGRRPADKQPTNRGDDMTNDKRKIIIIIVTVAALLALTALVIATEDVGAQQRVTRYQRTPVPSHYISTPVPGNPDNGGANILRKAGGYATPTPSAQRSSSNTARRSGR